MTRTMLIALLLATAVAVVYGAVPDQVATPTLDSVTGSSMQYSWTAPNDNGATITGYRVRMSPEVAMGFLWEVEVAVAPTTRTVEDLDPGTDYYVTVTALSTGGDGTESAVAGPFTTQRRKPQAPTTAPVFVTSTAFSITVSYTAPAANDVSLDDATVTGYRVHVAETAAMTGAVSHDDVYTNTAASPEVRQREITGLTPNTDYYFTYTLLTSAPATEEDSDASPVSAAPSTTLGQPVQPVQSSAVAPGGVTATSVIVQFNETAANGATITGYRVRVAESMGGPFTNHASTDVGTFTRTFTGLASNTDYYFDVIALVLPSTGADSVSSPVSDVVHTLPRPAKPAPPRASRDPTLRTSTSVGVDIHPVTAGGGVAVSAYKLRLTRVSNNAQVFIDDVTDTTISHQFSGLVAANAYTAAVQAKVADPLVAEASEYSDESALQLLTLDTTTYANSFATGPSVPAPPPRTVEVLVDEAIGRGITTEQVTFDMHALNAGKVWAVLLTQTTFDASAPTAVSIKAGTGALCTIANEDVTALTLHQFRLSGCAPAMTAATVTYKLVVYTESVTAVDGELVTRDVRAPSNFVTTTPTRTYTASTLSVSYQTVTGTGTGTTYGMMVPAARADRVRYADLMAQSFEGVAVGVCGWSNVALTTAGQDNTHSLSACTAQQPDTLYSILIMVRTDDDDYARAFVQHRAPSNRLYTAVVSEAFTPAVFAPGTFDYDVGNVPAANNTFNITVTCHPSAVLSVGLVGGAETATVSGTKRTLVLSTGPNTVRVLVTTVGITSTYTWTVFMQPPASTYDAADMEWTFTSTTITGSALAIEVAAVLPGVEASQVKVTSIVAGGAMSQVQFRVDPPVPPASLVSWSGASIATTLSAGYGTYAGTILSTLVTPLGVGEVKSSFTGVDLCATLEWKKLGQCTAVENLYCFTNACQNGGACQIDVPTNNVVCTCLNGYFGPFCEAQIGVVAAGSLALNATATPVAVVNLNATANETVGTTTSNGMLVVANTIVRFRARVRGSRSVAVKYGPAGDRLKFACTLAETPALLGVANEPTSVLEASEESVVVCSVGAAGFGADMALTLLLDDTRYTSPQSEFSVADSLGAGNLLRFPRPLITPQTLHIDGKPVVVLGGDTFSTTTGTSLLGETLVFGGEYFVATTSMQVRFSNGASTVLCAVNVVRTTSTLVVCDLGAGKGADYKFVVDFGQESTVSADVFEYPVPPTIDSVTGCETLPGAGSEAIDCPTHALKNNEPVLITVHGQKLFDPLSITVGGSECTGVTFINVGTEVTCRLPVGAGYRQLVSAVSRGLISDPVPKVSYERPTFTSIVGCSPDSTRAAGRGIHLCQRTGGDSLTINGNNFGPRVPFVLVGSSICTQVEIIAAHFSVRCNLPTGTALGRVVLLVQDAGEVNTDTVATRSTVSYSQCLAGTRNNGLACTNCTAGRTTSVASQNQCLGCSIGEFQPMPGQSSCDNCLKGTFQDAQGAGGCRDCQPGSYNAALGQGVCPVCLGGEFSNTTRAQFCYVCPAGSYSADNSTRCEQCTPGKYAPLERSKECVDTPPGTYSNIEGSQSATPCSLGEYQSSKNSTFCIKCPPGKFSNVLGREQCFDCKDQQYQDESGKTFCKSCAVAGVVCTPTSVRTESNYWLHREPREVFSFACPEGICTGENECADHRQPFETNPMCGFCLDKHGEWGGLCVWCDGWHLHFVLLYFVQLFLLVWIIHSIMQPDEHDSRHYTSENVLKIFFYFMQVALVIVGQALPKGLYWLHYFMLNIGKATAAWNVCYGQLSGLALITLETLTPALLWGALAIIMGVYRISHELEQRRREKDGRHRKKFRRTPFTLSALYLYLLSYQLVAGAVFRYFDCVNVLGENVIFTAPSVSCDSPEYKSLRVVFTLVAIVWVGVLPLAMIFIMIFYTHGENDIRVNKLVYELVSKKLMLLYGSWHSNAYFWEGAILIRRMMYAGFDVLYAAQLENKFLAFVLVSLASLTHHYVIRPPKPVEMKKNRPTRQQLRELRQATHRRASEASISSPAGAGGADSDGGGGVAGDGPSRNLSRRSSLGRRLSRVFVSKARERSVSRDWSNMTGSFASLAMLQMRSAKGDAVVNNLLRPNPDANGMEMDTYDDDDTDNMDEYKYDDDVQGTGGGGEGKESQMLPAWYDDEVARESQKQEYIVQIQRLNREIRRIDNGGQFEAPMAVRLAVPRIFSDRDTFLFGTRIVHLAIERDQLMVRVGGGYRREEDFLNRWAHQEARALGVSEADVAHAITKIDFSRDAAEDMVKRKLKKLARGRFMRRHALLERLHAEVDQRERQIDDLDSVDLRVKYKEEAERKAAEDRRRRREKRRREEAEKRRVEHEERLRELAEQEEAWDKEWEDHWRKHRLVGIRAHKSHGPFRRPMENYLETASLAFLLILAVLRTAFRPPMPLALVVLSSLVVLAVGVSYLLLAVRRKLAVVYNSAMKKYDAYRRSKRKTGDDWSNIEMLRLGERSRRSSLNGGDSAAEAAVSPTEAVAVGTAGPTAASSTVAAAVSLFGGSLGRGARAGNAGAGAGAGMSASSSQPLSVPEEDEEEAAEEMSSASEQSEPSESLPALPDEVSHLGAVAAAYTASSTSGKKKKKKKKGQPSMTTTGGSSRRVQEKKKTKKKRAAVPKDTAGDGDKNFFEPPLNPSFKNEQGMSVSLPPPGTVSQFDDYIRMLHHEEGVQPLMRLPTALGGLPIEAADTSATTLAGTRAVDTKTGRVLQRRMSGDSPRKMSLPHDEPYFQAASSERTRRRSMSGDHSPTRRGSFDNLMATSSAAAAAAATAAAAAGKKKKKVKRKLRTRSGSKMALMESKYAGDDAGGYDSDPEVVGERGGTSGDVDGGGGGGDDDDEHETGYHSDPETAGEPGMPSALKKKWTKRGDKKRSKSKTRKGKKGKKKKAPAAAAAAAAVGDDEVAAPSYFGSSAQLNALGVSVPPPPTTAGEPGQHDDMRRLDTFESMNVVVKPSVADTFESLPESILKHPTVTAAADDDDDGGDDDDEKAEAAVVDYASAMSGRRRIRFEKPEVEAEAEPPIPPGMLTVSKSLSSVDRLLAMTPVTAPSSSRRLSAPSVTPLLDLTAITATTTTTTAPTDAGPVAPSSARSSGGGGNTSAIDRLMALSARMHPSVENKER